MKKSNLFQLPSSAKDAEIFEAILQNGDFLLERIISTGQITPSGEWYDQDKAEWVVLLQGEATLLMDNLEGEQIQLQAGDHLLIPAHRKHRVIYTSKEPACVWLALHFNSNQ